jgi:hypothetical protein
MTATPESWDDVGCLRLQVDCVSQKVENDVGCLRLQVDCVSDKVENFQLQFQKLSDQLALARQQEQKKERCEVKVCIIFAAVLFGCVLALLACGLALWLYMTFGGSESRMIQRLSDEVWTMHVDEFKASGATTLAIRDAHKPKQKPVTDAVTKLKELLAEQRRLEEAEKATKEKYSTDTKELVDSTTTKTFEDHEMTTLPPLRFQMWSVQSNLKASTEVLKRARRGMFWVCFPATDLKQFVKTYTPVFNNVAHSQTWRMYPFVYLDTRKIETYYEHFCDDISKVTFVMEKRSEVIADNKNTSSRIAPGNMKWVKSETRNPMWFRRVFEPDQVIQAPLVEEFLHDVHSGKLPEMRIAKGDL